MDKIQSAIKIIKIASENAKIFDEPVELAYSGGKDSDVLLRLAQMSGIDFKPIYRNTTIDPPGTIQHVRSNNVEVCKPKLGFFQLIEKKGLPSLFRRFCCQHLKEVKLLNTCLTGVRIEESVKRKQRYKTFNYCKGTGKNKVNMFMPIWDWSLQDVTNFIKNENIQLAPHYYRLDGSINFKKRLGCMACPLQSDRGLGEFKRNPAILHGYIRSLKKYYQTHALKFFQSVYDVFVCSYFFKNVADFELSTSEGFFGKDFNSKEFLQNYFKTAIP